MRKVFLIAAIVLFFTGCTINRDVSGKGIPEHVSHIEFWNGGTNVRTYENATVKVRTLMSSGAVGKTISYYFYDVTSGGITETIVDSESLSIVFRE